MAALPVDSFRILPVQRIPRYELFLKVTIPEHFYIHSGPLYLLSFFMVSLSNFVRLLQRIQTILSLSKELMSECQSS